jgi:hypothetical protein
MDILTSVSSRAATIAAPSCYTAEKGNRLEENQKLLKNKKLASGVDIQATVFQSEQSEPFFKSFPIVHEVVFFISAA